MADPEAYVMKTLGMVIYTDTLIRKRNLLGKGCCIVHHGEQIALIAKRLLVHHDDSDGACLLQLQLTQKKEHTWITFETKVQFSTDLSRIAKAIVLRRSMVMGEQALKGSATTIGPLISSTMRVSIRSNACRCNSTRMLTWCGRRRFVFPPQSQATAQRLSV